MYAAVLAGCWLVVYTAFACDFTADLLPSFYGCEQSSGGSDVKTCTGINGCNLTVPCGTYQPSTNHTIYHYDLITVTPMVTITSSMPTSFLVLIVSLSHLNAKVLCKDIDGLLQAEYSINVLYPPMEVELDNPPDPIDKRRLTVTCPIEGNPRPHIDWTRYSDIDEASVLSLPDDLKFHDEFQTSWTIDSWSTEFNGFYECCGTNSLGHICYNDIISFRIFSYECDLPNVEESGVLSVLENKQAFAPQESFTLQCLFFSAIMDQPPSWWWLPSTVPVSSDPIRIKQGNGSVYRINYYHDNERCYWISRLTIVSFSSSLAGLYSCYRGLNQQSINITLQDCYRNSNPNSSISVINSNKVNLLQSNVSLTCVVENSTPAIPPRWCRVSPSDDGECIYNLKENSTFSEEYCRWVSVAALPNITRDSEGVYRCLVPNTSLIYDTTLTISEGAGITASMSASIGIVMVIVFIVASIAIAFVIAAIYIRWFSVASYSRTAEPPVEGFKWDVFISYHNESEDLVIDHIKGPLENAQYEVCWHHDDFIVGKPITDNINEAVDNSRKVVVVLSKNFTSSDHCMMELDRTLYRLQTTRTRCIVPIVTDVDCEVPLELRSKVTYWPIIEGFTDIYQQLIETIGKPMAVSSSGTEGMTKQVQR